MRATFAIAVVLAVAVAAWLLTTGDDPTSPAAEPGDASEAVAPASPGLSSAPRAPKKPEPDVAARPPSGVVPAILDRGAAAIHLAPEDGIEPRNVRLSIERMVSAVAGGILPIVEEDGTHRYPDLPVGKYRLRVTAEGTEDSTAEFKVVKDETVDVTVPLRPGAVVAYDAVLWSGERPESVTLSLRDARGNAVPVTVTTIAAAYHAKPGQELLLPPVGKLIGIRAGRYTLRATSPAGEYADVEIDATAGAQVDVPLKIRR